MDYSHVVKKICNNITKSGHFFLNSQLKMRNKLAEDVLNENMLHLRTYYQRSLGDKGEELQGNIELLQHTSVIIKNFI